MNSARIARPCPVKAMNAAGVPRNRSVTGPMSGATTAKGASVSRRYNASRGRAASTETLKNNEPASDTVMHASAAVLSAWTRASAASGSGPNTRAATFMRSYASSRGSAGCTLGSRRDEMARVRSRIASSTALLTLVAAVLFGACSDTSSSGDREAKIVAASIRALVLPEDDETKVTRAVFVGSPATEGRASLDLQADVLKELDEFESLRFVDDRDEAISDKPPRAVHSDGVYLEIGPVPESGSRVTVPATRYIDRHHRRRLRLHLA